MSRAPTLQSSSFLVTAVFALTGLAVVGQLYLPLPILSELEQQYGTPAWPASWILSAFGLAYALGFLFFGPLSDRHGRRKVLLFGMLSMIFATILVTLAETGSEMILARALQGFCAASFPPVALTFLGESLPSEHRPIAIAWMSFAFLSAAVLAQIFVMAAAAGNLEQAEIITVGLYALAFLALLLTTRTRNSPSTIAQGGIIDRLCRMPTLIFQPALFPYYLSAFTLLLVLVTFYALISNSSGSTLEKYGFSLMTLRLAALPGMAATFLAYRLAQRYGAPSVLLVSFALIGAGLLCAGVSITNYSGLGLVLGNLFLVAGISLAVPLMIVSIGARAPAADRGSSVALYTFVLFCGASSAPLIAAWLIPLGIRNALLVLCAFPVVAILTLVFWPRLFSYFQDVSSSTS